MPLGNRHTSPSRPKTPDQSQQRQFSLKPTWMQKLLFFVRDDSRCPSPDPIGDGVDDYTSWPSLMSDTPQKCPPTSKDLQRPLTGLPRQATFKRQNSERRERLCPVELPSSERRAISSSRHLSTCSMGRRRTRSSPPPTNLCRTSAPATVASGTEDTKTNNDLDTEPPDAENNQISERPVYNDSVFDYEERSSRPVSRTSSCSWDDSQRAELEVELDTKWILNLSMHFRDKSDREKFFVTYAETPRKWRRVTVSCDYRTAEPGSLEMDLKELQFQRDKSRTIYEAIRESLIEIQFYETVTNLKLETTDGRLHVHVTEDVNEIIPYPSRSMVRHILDEPDPAIRPMELCESDISFDAHLSGFVYRVLHQDKVYIKKEIPSPDTIDEFLYEINALHALHYSQNVIKLEAIILDDTKQFVKGLLITFAERGAIVDILYENKGRIPWEDRVRWARQAVTGLRDIHEEGYVQGDFTLSNIVVDGDNNAKIIDINRRGCPVGWEPPEIAQKIASNQRISMYIGEKSDIYQLGMTLWALAMDDDEPERHDPPLMADSFPSEVPDWFGEMVRICLSEKPRDRLSAKELVHFSPKPSDEAELTRRIKLPPRQLSSLRSEPKQYINPDFAVERDDIERFKNHDEGSLTYSPQSSKDDPTFTYPRSSEYDKDSSVSHYESTRGRNPRCRADQEILDKQLSRTYREPRAQSFEFGNAQPQILEIFPDDEDEAFDEVELDGKPYMVRAGTFNSAELRFLNDKTTPTGRLIHTHLGPTSMDQSPSPFRLPNWQRSLSETTPKSSRIRMLSEASNVSPEISPRSTSLSLIERPASAEPFKSARCSENISARSGPSLTEKSVPGLTQTGMASTTDTQPLSELLPIETGAISEAPCAMEHADENIAPMESTFEKETLPESSLYSNELQH